MEIVNDNISNEKIDSYIVQNSNNTVLMKSSSGGAFYSICEYIIENGGYCCAPILDINNRVIHMVSNDMILIQKMIGSKYVQSELGNTYCEIKRLLDNGSLVMFSGTPCQVYGLKNYIGKKYKNLLTVDVVCRGAPSPQIWNLYLNEIISKYKMPIKNINFRSKRLGYHSSVIKIDFKNGKCYMASPRSDMFLRAYYDGFISRPTCHQCIFKGINRESDLTLFDSWHPENIIDGFEDNDKGHTNIIVHSQEGKEILLGIKHLNFAQVEINKMIPFNGGMVTNSADSNPNRIQYFETVRKYGIKSASKDIVHISMVDILIDYLKRYIYDIGLLNVLKKFKLIIKG